MKTKYLKTVLCLLIVALGGVQIGVEAKSPAGYITISGTVKDKRSNKKLEYVSISVPGTGIGTVSNTEGGFSIKVKDSIPVKVIELSHIGYSNQQFDINGEDVEDVTIYLSPNANVLKGVVVRSGDPQAIVEEAVRKIERNYSEKTNRLTGFYRETIKKRRSYINISEAILEIYKKPYSEDIFGDKVQVYKGRQLLSQKSGDTLIVKFQGGPNLSTFLDVVKNTELILDLHSLPNYKFTMENQVMIDERPHYVIGFSPRVVLPYPLHYGKFYIEKETLTFSRVEFSLSMDDKSKATRAILRKKPFRMHFKPEEVSYLVTYKQQGGKSYLNYMCSEIRFKCDWKRRLFSTGYTVVSEMVVTDRKEDNVEKIPGKLAFNERHSLSDKVANFYDPEFWEDYNIIEPTESLEKAVGKLKKQQND